MPPEGGGLDVGLLDTLFGRTKVAAPDLDALFSLPSAAITLESAAGMSLSGRAGVCYKPPTGQGFTDMQDEVMKLLAMDGTSQLRTSEDTYGYRWIVVDNDDPGELVSQVHVVNSSLADAGWGPQLLCSVFGLAAPAPSDGAALPAASATTPPAASATAPPATTGGAVPATAFLVYLFKRGTFYPFVPDGHEHRSTERELQLRSLLESDLKIEPELDRWFPLWDLPVS